MLTLLFHAFSGKEQAISLSLGGLAVVIAVLTGHFQFSSFSFSTFTLIVAIALFFSRYPDCDIVFALARRELLRQARCFGRLPRWVESAWVTGLVAGLSITTTTLVPLVLLWYDAIETIAPLMFWCAFWVPFIMVRAYRVHAWTLGSHWIYGHHPLIVVPASAGIGYALGALVAPPVAVVSMCVAALATCAHFWCDSAQEDLGVPWLSPLLSDRHLTASGVYFDAAYVREYFLAESEAFIARLCQPLLDELKTMAAGEGVVGKYKV